MKGLGIRRWVLIGCVGIPAVVACSSGNRDGNPDPGGPVTANLEGAVAVALRPAVGGQAIQGFAMASPTGTPPACGAGESELVMVDSSGNVSPVLSEPYGADWIEQTDTHVLVRGVGYVQTVDGESAFWCCMLALPKDSGPAKCLSRDAGVGNFDPYLGSGIAVRGDEVFFGQSAVEDGEWFYRLVYWDGAGDQLDYRLQLGATQVTQPFVAAGTDHACVSTGDPGAESDSMLCGKPLEENPGWSPLDLTGGAPLAPLMVGTSHVFARGHFIDLNDLATTLGGPYELGIPSGTARVTAQDGSVIALNQEMIQRVAPPDVSEILHGGPGGGAEPWQYLIGQDQYAFAYGASDLRRIDLATAVVSTNNFLSTVNMLEVTSIAFTTENRIRLAGTDGTGQPTTVLVHAATGEITTEAGDVPTFTTIEYLQ